MPLVLHNVAKLELGARLVAAITLVVTAWQYGQESSLAAGTTVIISALVWGTGEARLVWLATRHPQRKAADLAALGHLRAELPASGLSDYLRHTDHRVGIPVEIA